MRPRSATRTRCLRTVLFLGFPLLASTASAQIVGDNAVPRDQMMGRWMNFEVAMQHPFEFDPQGQIVYSINQPGSRVVARDRATQQVQWEVPMGLGLSSIRLRRGANQLWCVDRVAGSVSILDLGSGQVLRTIRVHAEPHDLVFDAAQTRAYVSCSAANKVDIISTSAYEVVNSITIPAMQPRGIERVGSTVFVVPFVSGNGTAPKGNPATGHDSDVRSIEHVPQAPGLNPLPDRDLFAIKVTSQPETDVLDEARTVSGLGTILYNVHLRPGTTQLWIPHTDALNADFTGERNFVDGQVVRNRIAVVDAITGHLDQMIDLDALAPSADARCSPPTHVSFTPDGMRAFVCGYGSDSLATLDVTSLGLVSWAGSIDVHRENLYPDGAGPRASALDLQSEFLWVYNKGENSYARVPLADLPSSPAFSYLTPKARSNGWDPTPADINQGRMHFIRTDNSNSRTSSCDSCHMDGGTDMLAWDLSAYLDPEGTPADQLNFGTDVKGPMVTQGLRHLRELGPFHWRGEKKVLQQFDGTFIDLFERHNANGVPEGLRANFRYVSQYLEHLAVPANPRQAPDRRYTNEQLNGASIFMTQPVRDNLRCMDCHVLPLGTAGEIVDHLDAGLAPTTVVPTLRGVFDKLTPEFVVGGDFGTRTELGAGLTHSGSGSSITAHLERPLANGSRRFMLTSAEAHKIETFLKALDTGLAPATAFQVTANATNAGSVRQDELIYLLGQAYLGNCDLVYRYGPVDYMGGQRYMTGMFDTDSGQFRQASINLPNLSAADLIALAEQGTAVTFLGVPVMMGWPMGLDRDNDKLLDLDELPRGTDPENDDTDNDGFPDGYEVFWATNPLASTTNVADTAPPQVIGAARIVYVTTNAIKFELTTDEPTRMYIAYNGGGPVLRAPLFPKHDTEFSEIIGELQPGTDYTVQLSLNDPAGNSAVYEFQTRTLELVQPVPTHVQNIQLTMDRSAGGMRMRVTMSLREGDHPAQPGYNLVGRVYHEGSSGLSLVADQVQTWLINPNGIANMYVDIPPSITPGSGTLLFVIDHIDAPPGRPAYVGADNMESMESIQF